MRIHRETPVSESLFKWSWRLKISQYSRENTCVGVLFLIKFQKLKNFSNLARKHLSECLVFIKVMGWKNSQYLQENTSSNLLSWNITAVSLQLKSLYLHYHSAYGHQTWQDSNLPWWLLPKKSHDSLIAWLCEITWQTKTIISPLSECPWPSILARGYLTLMGSCQKSHMTLWSRGPVRTSG